MSSVALASFRSTQARAVAGHVRAGDADAWPGSPCLRAFVGALKSGFLKRFLLVEGLSKFPVEGNFRLRHHLEDSFDDVTVMDPAFK